MEEKLFLKKKELFKKNRSTLDLTCIKIYNKYRVIKREEINEWVIGIKQRKQMYVQEFSLWERWNFT